MDVTRDNPEFYDRRYADGYMNDWPAWKKHRVLQLVSSLDLPACGRALDFGCGNGVFTQVLREALPEWTVEGTDLSSTAVRQAAERHPESRFFPWPPPGPAAGQYDLIFTHHVLEHVTDLEGIWRELGTLLQSDGRVLHVLPCGNAGSLEQQISSLRGDGIDPARGDCFFFEEEGHLRRLTTEGLVALGRRTGYTLVAEYYANHWYGAIEWITRTPTAWVLALTDPRRAVTVAARRRLRSLRVLLVGVHLLRLPRALFHTRGREVTLKRCVRLAAACAGYPVALLADWYLQRQTTLEWRLARGVRSGSEMYLCFRRDGSGAHSPGRPAGTRRGFESAPLAT